MPIHDTIKRQVLVERKRVTSNKSAGLQVPRELVEDRFLKEAKDADGLEEFVEVVTESRCGRVVGCCDVGVQGCGIGFVEGHFFEGCICV